MRSATTPPSAAGRQRSHPTQATFTRQSCRATRRDSYAAVGSPVTQGPKRQLCDRPAPWGIPQHDAWAQLALNFLCRTLMEVSAAATSRGFNLMARRGPRCTDRRVGKGRIMHTIVRHMATPDPSSCRRCGRPKVNHGIYYVRSIGAHSYIAPTSQQILARMRSRSATAPSR